MASTVKRWTTESWILLALICVPLFFLTATMDVFNAPKEWLLLGLSCAAFAHFALSGGFRNRSFSQSVNLVSILCFILIVSMIVSNTFTATPSTRAIWGSPGRANGLAFYGAVLLCVVVASRMFMSPGFEAKIARSMYLLFCVNICYALIQNFGLDPINWNNPYNPIIGTFGNPNFISAFLGVGSIYFFLAGKTRSGTIRWMSWFLSLVSIYLTFATESIQGPLLVVIGLAIIFLIKVKPKVHSLWFKVLLLVLSLLAAFTYATLLGYGPFGERLFQYTLKLRMEYWQFGIKGGLDNPLTGLGVDSYVEAFRKYRSQEFVTTYGVNLTSDSAHSVPFNILANFGILNFSLFAILTLIILRQSIKSLIQDTNFISAASVLSVLWILMFIQSLFSIEQIGLSTFQWIIGGLILNVNFVSKSEANLDKSKTKNHITSKHVKVTNSSDFSGELAFLVLIGVLALTSTVIREEMKLKSIVQTNVDANLTNESYDEIAKGFGAYTKEEFKRALWYVDFLLRAEKVAEARETLLNLLLKDPEAVEAREQLARIDRYQGSIKDEISNRLIIKTQDPSNFNNLLMLADAYLVTGNNSEATNVSRLIIDQAPDPVVVESASLIVERAQR